MSAPASIAPAIIVSDDYGVVRRLKPSADCGCFEGTHDLGNGLEPYWLPAAVIEAWRAREVQS